MKNLPLSPAERCRCVRSFSGVRLYLATCRMTKTQHTAVRGRGWKNGRGRESMSAWEEGAADHWLLDKDGLGLER